eukprot:5422588-Lingulodinium_polyedra.AAC.1
MAPRSPARSHARGRSASVASSLAHPLRNPQRCPRREGARTSVLKLHHCPDPPALTARFSTCRLV